MTDSRVGALTTTTLPRRDTFFLIALIDATLKREKSYNPY